MGLRPEPPLPCAVGARPNDRQHTQPLLNAVGTGQPKVDVDVVGPHVHPAPMNTSVSTSLLASRERWGERVVAMLLVGLSLELFVGSGYHPIGVVAQHVALWPPILVLMAWLACRDRRAVWAQLRSVPLLLVLLAWSVASVAWSVDPITSTHQSIGLIGTTLGVVWMAARFERVEMAWLVAVPLLIAALASVGAILLAPDHTIVPDMNPHDPSPRGLFSHRNRFGGAMALATPLLAGLAWHSARKPAPSDARRPDTGLWLALTGAVLCAVLTVVSGSATAEIALLAAAFAVGIGSGLPRLAQRGRGWLVAACTALTASALALVALTPTLLETLFDRNLTLTGRVPLWELLLSQHVADRPWLGYGLGAFWPNHDVDVSWDPPHGHNSFVDITLELGVVASLGLIILLVWLLLRALRRQWHAAAEPSSTSRPLSGTWAVLLVVLGTGALTRDPIWRAQQLQLVILVASALTIDLPNKSAHK